MPHIIIEYTPNLPELPFDAMLAAVARRLAQSPEVTDEADLKLRVVQADHYRVGLADADRAFIHVTVRILEGRTAEQKQDFSQRVLDGMLEHMPALQPALNAHLSVEVQDMDRGSYRKHKLP